MNTIEQLRVEINKDIESLDKSIRTRVLLAQQETAKLFKQRYPKRRLEFHGGMGTYGCTVYTENKEYCIDNYQYERAERFNAKYFPMLVDFLEFISNLDIHPNWISGYISDKTF